MKKLFVSALVLLLVSASAATAVAAKRRAPVATTMYAHGPSPLGEIDGIQWVANTFPTTSPLTLDGVEPTESTPKSQSIATPVINSRCTGTPIANPVFQGELHGKITGGLDIVAHFVSAPGTITARVWTDVAIFQCNDAYVEPDAVAKVELPSGQGEVKIEFPKLNVPAKSIITVQILAEDIVNGYEGQIGRLLYDSVDTPTRLEFDCIPTSGSSCIP